MRVAVIVFPGSNCDRDAADAILQVTGRWPKMVWHREAELNNIDLVVLPGGFAYGDYLRPGAIAAQSPIMQQVLKHARDGGYVLGICNGFQVLTEIGLLPGVLMPNSGMKFVCKPVKLKVENCDTSFTKGYKNKASINIPIAHHDGNYLVQDDELSQLEDNGQVAFRYETNPNGSVNDIAGIINSQGNVLGMMPHPERAMGKTDENKDGEILFKSLMEALQ
ncbi:MAG: phosphoribosylformylglycinamidine synthase subunit PurQ [Robiginitomaculum sp.]|nr:phosphoribosylformylglycinamidine synthase subunit PurQ [Robiginitomaculum sp.]